MRKRTRRSRKPRTKQRTKQQTKQRSQRKKRVTRRQRGGAIPLAAATCAPCMGATATSGAGILGGLTALFSGTGLAVQRYVSKPTRRSNKRKKTKRK